MVYAATSMGLLRSLNSGGAWTVLTSDIIHSLSFHPAVSRRMYAASSTQGILTSSDGGDTFQPVNHGFTERPFRALAVSGNEIYVTAPGEGQPALFRSVDGGATWHSDPAWPRNLRHAAIQQTGSGTVFTASSTQVYASRNGGKTWTALPEVPGGRVLALAGTASGALAGSPKGLFAWSAAGSIWKPVALPETGPVQELFGGAEGFIAAGSDSAILTSSDGGSTWRACSGVPDAKLVFNLSGSGGAGSFVLMGTTSGLLRSGDGCQSWTEVRDGLNTDTVALVTVDPEDASIAFAVQHDRSFISGDRGRSWKPLGGEARPGDFPVALRASGTPGIQLFALFSTTGLMVRTVGAAEAAAGLSRGILLPPKVTNLQGGFRR